MSYQIHARTIHPRNADTKTTMKFKLSQRLAVQLRFGNQNTAGNETLVQLFPLNLNLLTDESNDRCNITRSRNHQNLIPDMKDRIVVRNLNLAVHPTYPRDHKITIHQTLHLADTLSLNRRISYTQ